MCLVKYWLLKNTKYTLNSLGHDNTFTFVLAILGKNYIAAFGGEIQQHMHPEENITHTSKKKKKKVPYL